MGKEECLAGSLSFSGNGNLWKAEAEAERYKRLVGELYAEIDFLKKLSESCKILKPKQTFLCFN